jgi:hypothetical protein
MNAPIPSHKKKGSPWRAWILRWAIGVALIGMSIWGIALCREIFRAYVGPATLPQDSSFANLGAWAAWALFFGPLAVAGMAMVWSTLRKMGALGHFAYWLGDRAGQPDTYLAKSSQRGGVARGSDSGDPHGLESLSAETVERLQRSAARAATILGALAGAFLLGIGVFGLSCLLLFSGPSAGSSMYVPLATGKVTISFAVFSGVLVFVGIVILQQTFRRENSGWLLPLRLFTYLIVRRRAGERTGHAGQYRPGTKQHPRV